MSTTHSGATATVINLVVTIYTEDRLSDGSPCCAAIDPDLPGCYGFGATQDLADESLARARNAYRRTTGET